MKEVVLMLSGIGALVVALSFPAFIPDILGWLMVLIAFIFISLGLFYIVD